MSDQPQETSLSTAELVEETDRWEHLPEPAEEETQAPESAPADENQPVILLTEDMTGELRSRWSTIQTGFVDEPRTAVEQADSLVAEVMEQISETLANERTKLEDQWNHGENVSTEDLRLALQQYRTFFNRLMSI